MLVKENKVYYYDYMVNHKILVIKVEFAMNSLSLIYVYV